jgi:hypothetical protein
MGTLEKEVLIMRPAAMVLLRLGLVLLVMAVLIRFLPVPNQADVVGDDLAILASGALVAVAFGYLRLTKED